ncbi:MAG: efflux RND transporter permease subunit [Phycisphaerae bacterium]|nr:efflux RND transporter permease subunit [Phycisphaerae bacterium]
MVGHSVAANLLMLMCLVGGYLCLRNIKQEFLPSFTLDKVTVTVAYPGASPEEIERGIILAIEEAVRGLDDVDEITSVANEGSGTVTVDLLVGADVQKVAQDIQSEIDRITTFPDDAEEPQVRTISIRRGVLTVVLYGDAGDTVLHELAERMRDQFLQDPDITKVDLSGIPPLEIKIEISQENLRRYGLTLSEVAARLRKASVDVPGGGLKTQGGEILVRVKERRDYGSQFARLPILTTADGSEVLLGQIATVDDGFEESDRYAKYNGKPAVMLDVYRVGDQTPVQVADAIRRQLKQFDSSLPAGIHTSIEKDRSDVYRQRVELLLKNGAMGLVLVLVILGLFLEARLAFWVMLGIPVSFLGSFLVLPAMDVTINMVSLFAYIIALGIVVDDAIVVGENIYHYRQKGMGAIEAAIKGTREVAMPVTFSILTNLVAFMPIYFIPGIMGKFFQMIPVVVCTVFLVSLGECLLVLPSHLGHQKDRQRRGISAWLHHRQQAFSRGFMNWVNNRYGPFLEFSLRHRYLTVALALSLLAAMSSYALSGRMGFELFPKVESDFAEAKVVLPYGSPVGRTEAILRKLRQGVEQVLDECGHEELVKAVIMDVGYSSAGGGPAAGAGRGGSHVGQVRVTLADPDVRAKIMSTGEFTNRWRKAVGKITGVESLKFSADSGGPGGRGRPVTVELSHRDVGVLERAGEELAAVLRTYPRAKDVDDGFQPGKQQLDYTIKPEGKSLGLTADDVSRQVRSAFYGTQVLRQQRGRNEIKIMVRLPEANRTSEQTIHDLMIRTPAGSYVPLREIATAKRGRAYMSINRRNGRRVIDVSADVTPQSKAGEILGSLKKTVLPELLASHPGLRYSFEGRQADIRQSMDSLKISFVMALLAIYVLLAIPFRSYSQPLIVMASIPFGVIGAFLGHLLMGYNLSVMSMFGIVALSGVVVNDSLIMIDFANRRIREAGLSHHDAICSAAVQRFRPILLTTLTTFGGLVPMIFETSRQARFLIPMALSLGYGILFATFITLVLVPSLYLAIEDAKHAAAKVRQFLGIAPTSSADGDGGD